MGTEPKLAKRGVKYAWALVGLLYALLNIYVGFEFVTASCVIRRFSSLSSPVYGGRFQASRKKSGGRVAGVP